MATKDKAIPLKEAKGMEGFEPFDAKNKQYAKLVQVNIEEDVASFCIHLYINHVKPYICRVKCEDIPIARDANNRVYVQYDKYRIFCVKIYWFSKTGKKRIMKERVLAHFAGYYLDSVVKFYSNSFPFKKFPETYKNKWSELQSKGKLPIYHQGLV